MMAPTSSAGRSYPLLGRGWPACCRWPTGRAMPCRSANGGDSQRHSHMRLISGPTLKDASSLGSRMRAPASGRWARWPRPDAANEVGLIHRGVMPQNSLIGDGDQAYLEDFGLTTSLDAAFAHRDRRVRRHARLRVARAVPRRRGDQPQPPCTRWRECSTSAAGVVPYYRISRAGRPVVLTYRSPPRLSERHPDFRASSAM
jgi:serine/threonine protein kinase